jgi:hypothetical protein
VSSRARLGTPVTARIHNAFSGTENNSARAKKKTLAHTDHIFGFRQRPRICRIR